jgi:hypothetical protein
VAFTSLEDARAQVAALSGSLAARGLALRAPPPEPTTCCGRGCNGCVWESWGEAMERWLAEAMALTATGHSREGGNPELPP